MMVQQHDDDHVLCVFYSRVEVQVLPESVFSTALE